MASDGNGKGNGNGRQAFDEATRGLQFTKDFHTATEAIMHDRAASHAERVYAWIKRSAWGNYRLYAAKEDGSPAYQCDCVADLGIDRRMVSNVVVYLEKRGYVRRDEKLLYPVITPTRSIPDKDIDFVTRSSDFRAFVQLWKVTHSSDFLDLEVARSTVKRLRKVILSDYKKSLASATNGGGILIEESSRVSEREKNSSSSIFPTASSPVEPPAPAKAEEEDPPSDYQTFKKAYPRDHFDEPKAKPAFQGFPKSYQRRVIKRLHLYLDCDRWKAEKGRWIPLASNWLKSCDSDPPPVIRNSRAPTIDWDENERIIREARAAEAAAVAAGKLPRPRGVGK